MNSRASSLTLSRGIKQWVSGTRTSAFRLICAQSLLSLKSRLSALFHDEDGLPKRLHTESASEIFQPFHCLETLQKKGCESAERIRARNCKICMTKYSVRQFWGKSVARWGDQLKNLNILTRRVLFLMSKRRKKLDFIAFVLFQDNISRRYERIVNDKIQKRKKRKNYESRLVNLTYLLYRVLKLGDPLYIWISPVQVKELILYTLLTLTLYIVIPVLDLSLWETY